MENGNCAASRPVAWEFCFCYGIFGFLIQPVNYSNWLGMCVSLETPFMRPEIQQELLKEEKKIGGGGGELLEQTIYPYNVS